MSADTVGLAAYVYTMGRPLQAQIEETPSPQGDGFANFAADMLARFGDQPLSWLLVGKRVELTQPVRNQLEDQIRAAGQIDRHRIQVILADAELILGPEFPHPRYGKAGRYGAEVGASGSVET